MPSKQRRQANRIPQGRLTWTRLEKRLIRLILQRDRQGATGEQPVFKWFNLILARGEMELLPVGGSAQRSCSSLLSR